MNDLNNIPDPIAHKLSRIVSDLETQLVVLEEEFGPNLYMMKYENGQYIAAPIIIALAQAYAALLNSLCHKCETT